MPEEKLTSWIDPLLGLMPVLQDYRWQLSVLLILAVTLLAMFVANRIMKRLVRSLSHTKPVWDDLLIDAGRLPVRILILVIGCSLALAVAAPHSDYIGRELPSRARQIAFILLLGWTLIRFIGHAEEVVLRRNKNIDRTTADAFSKLIRLVIVIVVGLVLLQNLGYSISGLLAFGGIGGLAVGFAAKDLLANFFGGLMIYLDRPFKVGDWVRSPDKNIEGVVEHVGWRLTVIRTFDLRPLYVPNATFNNISVENPSRMTHRRIFEYVGVRYDDAAVVKQIVDDIREMLVGHEEIDENNTLFVQLNRFGPSSLDIMVYTFTHTTNWGHYLAVREDVLLKIIDIVSGHGAEIAFPTTTVHLHEQPGVEAPPEMEKQSA
ncbi:mechanosensitive ion channel family protein [Marinobacterium mangrovicola]|uniref:MscS family membrane protein n=1 Tax=Marinobacterium mangrovicola TaxID=1476959 RepID=A0A4R1GNM6_9GAMM|nr:mechanosensitive ion channel family protein [Marinobacterium mangrovicola]TCK08873.1 MscS family membrane protein [Marinobacterium mangrovicola]